MNKYEHLFFDLDNTILDFDHASYMSFHSILEDKKLPSEGSYKTYKSINSKVWSEFENGEITAVELRAKRFDLFLDAMKWNGDGAAWNKLYLDKVIGFTKFVPGARSLLKNLSKKYKMHIVTNGLREVQRPRINVAEINNLISSITVSDEIGSAKPQAEFFKIAKKNANIDSNHSILMIGDSYNSDIKGAFNFGIDSCWFNSNKSSNKENLHKFEIDELPKLTKVLS